MILDYRKLLIIFGKDECHFVMTLSLEQLPLKLFTVLVSKESAVYYNLNLQI